MYTFNSMLEALVNADKLMYQGPHYESGEQVYVGDLWRLFGNSLGDDKEAAAKARDKYHRFESIAEQRNVSLRFDDEIITDEQGRAHECQPSSWGWVPTYRITDDGGIWAQDEIDESTLEDYAQLLLDSHDRNADQWGVDFSPLGFEKFDYQAESGWYGGQDDTPDKVRAMIEREHGDCDIIFSIDRTRQFDMDFSAWYRKQATEEEEAA